jgi:hypothetical protein
MLLYHVICYFQCVQELKLKEQVEALYAQGKVDEARQQAAAAAAAAGDAEGANVAAAVGDDAKIADEEDAGGYRLGAAASLAWHSLWLFWAFGLETTGGCVQQWMGAKV